MLNGQREGTMIINHDLDSTILYQFNVLDCANHLSSVCIVYIIINNFEALRRGIYFFFR